MRTEAEVEEYASEAYELHVGRCKKCHGIGGSCRCEARYRIALAAFEANVPQLFWNTKAEDIDHNTSVFKSIVEVYAKKLLTARRRGYGLLFTGDNGVGKTLFISYVLMASIRAGFTAYYTTLPQLDYDIKRGFKDRLVEERLNWLLTSDFLAIDEMGKEKYKAGESYINTQIERILKKRCDDKMPVLLASNMDLDGLGELYGPTVASMLAGRFEVAFMEPGDYRERLRGSMKRDMGYGE